MSYGRSSHARIIRVIILCLVCVLYCTAQLSGADTGYLKAFNSDAVIMFSRASGANANSFSNNSIHADEINSNGSNSSYDNKAAKDELPQAIDWAHVYGGVSDDYAFSIEQTSDGGYIVAGYTRFYGAGNYDIWILKLDASGNVTWQKTYGGASYDYAQSIEQTSDGGYIVAGYTFSFGVGGMDIWVLKLDATGNSIWQKTYGGTDFDHVYSIQQTSDGGYIVAGDMHSWDFSYADILVLKLDISGNVIWQNIYGGTESDHVQSIEQTSDGGYIAAGYTQSFGVWGDIWILKLDASGNVTWQKTYGGSGYDFSQSIEQTNDGGYIVAGYSVSYGAGAEDMWILKLDTSGNITWQKTYGGANEDSVQSIEQTSDGGYIVAGYTSSFGAGAADMWILKLNSGGNITWQKTYGGASYDYAQSIEQTSDGGYIVAGYTGSFGAGSYDMWILKLYPDGTMHSSCTFISDTNANAVNSSTILTNTNASILSSSMIMLDTGISGIDSVLTENQICSACPAPSGLTNNNAADLSGCTYAGVQINWNVDPADWGDGGIGTRSYEVIRDGSIIANDIPYGTIMYTDTSGTNGQTYVYKVRYVNGCGAGATTAGVQATDYPRPPTIMSTTAYDKSPQLDTGVDVFWQLPIDWGDNGTNVSNRGFRVYRESTDISGILPASTITYEDNAGANNTFYTYHVDASNGCVINTSYYSMVAIDVVTQVIDWAHVYGGAGYDEAQSIQQTSDGGYIVAGYTFLLSAADYNMWILKLDASGNVAWQKTYGGSSWDYAQSVQQTIDGGYIVAGYTRSFVAGNYDIWILKLDASGNILWQKTYGGSHDEEAYSIEQTSDGGYIVAGRTYFSSASSIDMWVLKLDASGNILWQKSYGGSGYEEAYSIQQTSDGGYAIAGYSESFGNGNDDMWVLKLDASGNVVWEKTYGGVYDDIAYSIQQTNDGGYIVAGSTWSFGAGEYDAWILKLDISGNITWQNTYGGSGNDNAQSIQQTTDGGYVVAGSTRSFGAGYDDIWVLKLDTSGNITWQNTYGGSNEDRAYSIEKTSDGGYVVAGRTGFFSSDNYDIWVLKINSYGTMNSSCSFIHSTSINPIDSAVIQASTNASISSPSITIADTGILGIDSGATDMQLCSTCSAPSGFANNTATDLSGCAYTGVQIGWNVDPADWGDEGTGTRTYAVLRDGFIIGTNLSYGTTSYIDTSGSNGKTYVYKVRYLNGCNSGATTTGVQATDYPRPPTIMNTTAQDKSPQLDTGVDISWPLPTDWGDNGVNEGSRGFRVCRDSTDISGMLPASTLTYEDNAGVDNTFYTYHVDAINGCGAVISYKGMIAIDVVTQVIDWAHVYGGSNNDYAQSAQQTSDGGYIVAGYTESFGYSDMWILKVDASGNVLWQKTYGGSDNDYAYSVRQTSDGNYIIAGSTRSFGAGYSDMWILKLDASGNVIWQKTYGGSDVDYAYSIQQTSDGGYIVAGYTWSFSGDWYEFCILRLDALGNVLWQRKYGGNVDDKAYSVQQTDDGGYIVAGYANSFGVSMWILKLNEFGGITWQKTYGGAAYSRAQSVQQTGDGGYIVAGYTLSAGASNYDFLILKLNSSGNVDWQKIYGGSGADYAYSAQQTSDGGYIVAGYTDSFGAGKTDIWVLLLDSSGNVTWQKTYGGSNEDRAYSIEKTSEGGYIIAGSTSSFGSGNYDMWILKLNPYGTMNSSCAFINTTSINPIDSAATSTNTNDSYSSSSMIMTDTVISGKNSGAIDMQICSTCPAPSGITNNTAADPNGCVDSGVQINWNSDPADWSDEGIGTRTYAVIREGSVIATNLPYGTTTYIDTSGTHGKIYVYKVRYVNGCGAGATTAGAQATDYPILPTKMNTTAQDISPQLDTGVNISWPSPIDWGDNGDDSGNRGFRVYRDSTDISGMLPASTLTYEDNGGANNIFYTYRVDTINSCGLINSYNGMIAIDIVTQAVDWVHAYGGSGCDSARSIEQTSDGGYIVAGYTESVGAGYTDFWVLKLDSISNVTWQKTYGGSSYEDAQSIHQTTDGSYIVAGRMYSYDSDSWDIWILALDSSGNAIWQKTYGGSYDDYAQSIEQTNDGGYIVAGNTSSFGAGSYDIWILKLDGTGNITWQNTYGGLNDDYAQYIQQTSDGGYIIAGRRYLLGAGYFDVWILKLDSFGNFIWQKTYGGAGYDEAQSIQQTSDEGYIIAGNTSSFGAGSSDMWILKLDSIGNITWQNAYGGANEDYSRSIEQTIDGGYIIAGYTYLPGAGGYDMWILKLDAAGNVIWQKTYGGPNEDYAQSIQQTSDGGYIIAGDTGSFGLSSCDIWVLKIYSDGTMNSSCTFINNTSINPINSSATSANTDAAVVSTEANPIDTNIAGASSNVSDLLLCATLLFLNPYNDEKPVVNDTGSSKANGIIEPDEMVELAGSLENIGIALATSVTGLLTSTDPIIISNPDAAYPDIMPDDHKTCTSCYSLTAPLGNRPATHWDFAVTENVSASGWGPIPYNYIYHVGESFSDVPTSYLFYPYIEKMLHSGTTSGCTSSTYCPANNVQRQQVAKFICASMEASHSGTCTTSSCSGIFADVQFSNPFCPYIEQLFNRGIVSGCQTTPLSYCPDNPVQRQAMAKFVCLGMQSANPGSCVTASCTGIFTDVPTTNPFCTYIEGLYNAGIIAGCGTNTYCPTSLVSRDQMAKFLVNGFSLEL